MSLLPGTLLGPCRVGARIGVGGMGEVYRATDTNLGRDVVIKVLPDALAQNAERLANFDREARALAALNPPNIGAIFIIPAVVQGEPDSSALPDKLPQHIRLLLRRCQEKNRTEVRRSLGVDPAAHVPAPRRPA